MANKALKAKYSSCAAVHTLQRQGALPAHTACMTVTGAKVYDFLTPMHVWELDTPFGRITRRLYYGTEEILKPKPSYDELVPNIGTTFVGIILVQILTEGVSKFYHPQTKLRKSNVFTSVYQKFCPQGVGGGVEHLRTDTPLWVDIPRADTPLGRHSSWTDTPR